MFIEGGSSAKSAPEQMKQTVKYWIACSGGVDSVVLVRLFHELGKNFGILHCNFQLRATESEKDEAFVRNLAQSLDVPYEVQRFDTTAYQKKHNIGVQLAARELRYNWFNEFIEEHGGGVCLAHHKDDQIETFLLQLWRGGRVKGLSGMPVVKNVYYRPLLGYTKKELVDLAIQKKWQWREDQSNQRNAYKRNLYRNELLPLMDDEVIGDVLGLVASFKVVLNAFNFEELPKNRFGAFELFLSDWIKMPVWIKRLLIDAHGLGKFPTHEIDKLVQSANGAMFKADKHVVLRVKDKLLFIRQDNDVKDVRFVEIPIDAVDYSSDDVYIDLEKVKRPLMVRDWKSSDKFTPLGMTGRKSISKYLKDAGVPSYFRKRTKVVVDANDQIVAVAGEIVAETFKVDASSQFVVKCLTC
jgi:tRNA(Ile)-lysidine synthase